MNTEKVLRMGLIAAPLAAGVSAAELDRIRPYDANPRYWEYRGQPILLVGASDTHNPFQWPADRLLPHLDAIAAAGANVIRNTMSDREQGNIRAFAEVEPGLYDLERWNPTYWEQFASFLKETQARGIMVQIELWDRFDHYGERWEAGPFNPKNNINYTPEESGLAESYPGHPGGNHNPFLDSLPGRADLQLVREFQERFITRVLELAASFDHVLFCVSNETRGSEEWGTYWAEFAHAFAKRHNITLQITEMWDPWESIDPMHLRTIGHPEIYDFIDLSQNSWLVGEHNWQVSQHTYRHIAAQPRPINTTKIYGNQVMSEQRSGVSGDNAIGNFWRNLIGGFASSRFHRPGTHGLGFSPETAVQISVAREWQRRFDVFRADPDSTHAFLRERTENEAYLTHIRGEAWSLFFPAEGSVELWTYVLNREFILTWASLDTGEWREPVRVAAPPRGRLTVATPGPGRWLVVVDLP